MFKEFRTWFWLVGVIIILVAGGIVGGTVLLHSPWNDEEEAAEVPFYNIPSDYRSSVNAKITLEQLEELKRSKLCCQVDIHSSESVDIRLCGDVKKVDSNRTLLIEKEGDTLLIYIGRNDSIILTYTTREIDGQTYHTTVNFRFSEIEVGDEVKIEARLQKKGSGYDPLFVYRVFVCPQ